MGPIDPTALQTIWFVLIAVLFLGYFVLEGFDFGVEMNVAALGRGDLSRRSAILRTIGPVWDGNEVWLLVAGGAMFAAFPEWYATLFSGFYLALLMILVALIIRVCAFKYREKSQNPTWQRSWDVVHVIGGIVPSFLWGVAVANIVAGVPIDENRWVTASLLDLLNPFAILGGVVLVMLFWLHGTVYLALRTDGSIRESANRLAGRLILPVIAISAIFLLWNQLAHSRTPATWVPLIIAAAALIAVVPLHRARREGWSFAATSLAIAAATIHLFGGLFPYVMPSTTDDALSLTVVNAASSEHTLGLLTGTTAVLLPLVMIYQAWSYWVFRQRITGDDGPTPPVRAAQALRRRYRSAFEQD